MREKCKKCISLLLVVAVLSLSIPTTAYADAIITVEGNDSDWSFKVKGKTYNEGVPGYGLIFYVLSGSLTKYTGKDKKVHLPSVVSCGSVSGGYAGVSDEIKAGVFADTNVTSITCNGATFKNKAFENSKVSSLSCSKDKDKEEVMTFEQGAFFGCTAKKISLSGRSVLKTGCFSGCDSVEEIVLSGSVTIELGAFAGCKKLKRIVFDYNTTIKDKSNTLAMKTLGCADDTVLVAYGATGLWKMRKDSAYVIKRRDPYISYNSSTKYLYAGDRLRLNAKLHNSSAISVKYLSSNTKVAKVSKSGKVTTLKSGKTKITILMTSSEGVYKESLNLMVFNMVNKSLTIKKGKSHTLKPGVSIVGGKITYTSSNRAVCTVSAKGKIIAKRVGKAVIKMKSKNGAVGKVKVRVIK